MKSVPPITSAFRPCHLLLGFATALLLNGCSLLHPHDDPTRFYVLTAPQATTTHRSSETLGPVTVELRPVDIPAYLRTKSIVIRTGANEIHLADFDQWGEPLDQGIRRVMAIALRSTGNFQSVTMSSHGDDSLRCDVAIKILACEGVREEHGAGSIHFAATWDVRIQGTNSMTTKHGEFIASGVAWDGKTPPR